MTKRKLGKGILVKGFKILNSVYAISIPRGTPVSFLYDTQTKTQEIDIDNFPVYLFREAYQGEYGGWIASVYEKVMAVHYHPPAPYPLSYFDKS